MHDDGGNAERGQHGVQPKSCRKRGRRAKAASAEFKRAKKIHLAHSQSAPVFGSPTAAPLTEWTQLHVALRTF